jgi:outer membrane protein insertion porin family
MILSGQDTPFKKNYCTYLYIVCVLLPASCATVPVRYQPGKPFVYKSAVNVISDSLDEEKKLELKSALYRQLDDSMKSAATTAFFNLNKGFHIIYNRMDRPPFFDSMELSKSKKYLTSLMKSEGFYNDSINYFFKIDTFKKTAQLRTDISFNVFPGKLTKLDSIAYNLDSNSYKTKYNELQRLAVADTKNSFLKRGKAFSRVAVANELDRLVNIYRNNGYFKITRDELIAVWDTMDVSLLRPTLDPFEQFEIIRKMQERRNNPTANIEIKIRSAADTAKVKRYYIGNVTVYPDFTADTLGTNPPAYVYDKENATRYKVLSKSDFFKIKFLPENIFLRQGQVYSQYNYLRTINRFNTLGAWRLVNIEPLPVRGDTVDFNIKLTPADKYSFNANIEGSYNQGGSSFLAGNLFGIGLNAGVLNRNSNRSANRANTNIRYGVELNLKDNFIQTQQVSIGRTIIYPRLRPKMKWLPERLRENGRSSLSVNGAYTDRRTFYQLTTFNASWGYDFQWNKKTNANIIKQLGIRMPNIEYVFFNPTQAFRDSLEKRPSLKNIFTNGLVSSFLSNYSVTHYKNKTTNSLSAGLEFSGLLAGLIPGSFIKKELFRFIKLDAEYKKNIKINKTTSFAMRLFGGIGIPMPVGLPTKDSSIPFIKAYFAGGPNSMRAWQVRRLGPGNFVGNLKDDDRFGDVRFEANAEYRVLLKTISGVRLETAFFTDIGNIWTLKNIPALPGGQFKDNWNFIAVDMGMGFRLDFGYFLIRLDGSLNILDPSPDIKFADKQNKFLQYTIREGSRLQLGINYPF